MEIVEKELSDKIFVAALKVHKYLGPGLLESTYQKCLQMELLSQGLQVAKEVQVDIIFENQTIKNAYKIDLLVDDKVIIECKSVAGILPVHNAQLMTYLKLSRKRLGILINFNVELLKNGYKRVVL
jgi:GxxExxY protein